MFFILKGKKWKRKLYKTTALLFVLSTANTYGAETLPLRQNHTNTVWNAALAVGSFASSIAVSLAFGTASDTVAESLASKIYEPGTWKHKTVKGLSSQVFMRGLYSAYHRLIRPANLEQIESLETRIVQSQLEQVESLETRLDQSQQDNRTAKEKALLKITELEQKHPELTKKLKSEISKQQRQIDVLYAKITEEALMEQETLSMDTVQNTIIQNETLITLLNSQTSLFLSILNVFNASETEEQ